MSAPVLVPRQPANLPEADAEIHHLRWLLARSQAALETDGALLADTHPVLARDRARLVAEIGAAL